MNISPLTIYLWQLADNVQAAALIFASITGIFAAFALFAWLNNGDEDVRTPAVLSSFFSTVFRCCHFYSKQQNHCHNGGHP